MNRLLIPVILWMAAVLAPIPSVAQVTVNIGVAPPPPLGFQEPPNVIVLPDTPDVYVDPELDVDLFFWNGWWWLLWDGHWFRSRYYDRDWVYFNHVPSFYYDVDPGWRTYYRNHEWHGRVWKYQRIPNRQLQQNWQTWHKSGYWQKQKNWEVPGYKPPSQQQRQAVRQQRQQQYQLRPEAQRGQPQPQGKQFQRQQPQPQVMPQRQEKQLQPQQPERRQDHVQPREVQRQGEPERQGFQGRPQGGEEEHRK